VKAQLCDDPGTGLLYLLDSCGPGCLGMLLLLVQLLAAEVAPGGSRGAHMIRLGDDAVAMPQPLCDCCCGFCRNLSASKSRKSARLLLRMS
jgi:hypothetical protein